MSSQGKGRPSTGGLVLRNGVAQQDDSDVVLASVLKSLQNQRETGVGQGMVGAQRLIPQKGELGNETWEDEAPGPRMGEFPSTIIGRFLEWYAKSVLNVVERDREHARRESEYLKAAMEGAGEQAEARGA